ncbi:MAG: serine hydrolase [Thermoplasmata archaeon]|nr:MAG: serine hydrolase [Thermoplasmata archaeon]
MDWLVLVVISFSIAGGITKHVQKQSKGAMHSFFPEMEYDLVNDELFEKIMLKLMEIAHMSALSAAIIKDNKLIWAKGFGLYDRENNKQADEKTIYLVASISKTFTATAIMQLYEKGYFDLDDDVNDYLPFSLRNPNYPDEPITFRMLLAHQSSLAVDPPAFYSYIPGDLEVFGYPYPWLKEYLVPGEIHYKPQVWTDSPPGEEMNYANVGYGLLGYLVEIISGKSFEEYCRENIFEPLEIKNTSFRLANLDAKKIAVPYVFQFGEYYPLLHYGILDYPAGGLRTNVLDLSHFLIAMINGGVYNDTRILSEESVKEMHTVQYPNKNYNFQYGLGWQIWNIGGETYIGHTGGLYGVATKMVFRKSDGTAIIFFTNKEIRNLREIIVFSLIERLLFWKANDDTSELKKERIEETISANKHLLKDLNEYSDSSEYYLNEILKIFNEIWLDK